MGGRGGRRNDSEGGRGGASNGTGGGRGSTANEGSHAYNGEYRGGRGGGGYQGGRGRDGGAPADRWGDGQIELLRPSVQYLVLAPTV